MSTKKWINKHFFKHQIKYPDEKKCINHIIFWGDICSGLQPRQFSQAAGIAQGIEGVVLADAENQADQDWSQGSQAFPLHDISNSGSGCAEGAFSWNPWPNPAVAFFDNTCEAGMICGTAENKVPEWRTTVACTKIVGKTGPWPKCLAFLVFFSDKMSEYCWNWDGTLVL